MAGPQAPQSNTFVARALQLGERIDLKGLERTDSFSKNPLAFHTSHGGTVVLFKTGTAVFLNMSPVAEDELVRGLLARVSEPLTEREREVETVNVVIDSDDSINHAGIVHIKAMTDDRLLLIAEALANSVSMAVDERRVGAAFDRVGDVARSLKARQVPGGERGDILEQLGEALSIQTRLAGRIDMNDKPDVLWDHPELERLWVKLIDEYDLKSRANAISQKLDVIKDAADTLGDILTTRTSHRLEWYIIALIALEIVLGIVDKFWPR